jgi:hypothetical protein
MVRVAAIGGRIVLCEAVASDDATKRLPQLPAGPQYKNPSEMSQRKALKMGISVPCHRTYKNSGLSRFVSRTQWAGRVNAREQTCGEFDRGALG